MTCMSKKYHLEPLGAPVNECGSYIDHMCQLQATFDLRHSTFGKRELLFLVSQPFWDLGVGLGCVKAYVVLDYVRSTW